LRLIFFFQKEVRETAEKYEFIELTREKIQGYEEDWSDGFSDDAYTAAIRAKFPNESQPRELKKVSQHYHRWIWILIFGDAVGTPQIGRPRIFLNNDRDAFHKLAKSMQNFYGLLSKNVHTSVFKLKYVRKDKLNYYLQHIGDNIHDDISALLRSEMKTPVVFTDQLRKYKGAKAKLVLKEDAKPKFFRSRPLPFSVRNKVSAELDRLVAKGILKPTDISV